MKTLRFVISAFAILAAAPAFAGTEGFIYQGKEYVVFKDGKKVGPTFGEVFPQISKTRLAKAATDRAPAASAMLSPEHQPVSFFTDGAHVKCYRMFHETVLTPLSCVYRINRNDP